MKPKPHEHITFPSGALRSDRTGKGRYDLISPHGMKRLAVQYEDGATHHKDPRNWEQGFPISRALCSALGHIYDQLAGDRSEDHLAAGAWQLFAVMHFEELIEQGKLPVELNDILLDSNTLPPDVAIDVQPPDIGTDEVSTVATEATFAALQELTGSWADKRFPQTDSFVICKHLTREVKEVNDALQQGTFAELREEAADCLLLLMHLAHKNGFNLLTEALKKFAINGRRQWSAEPDADGIYTHSEET